MRYDLAVIGGGIVGLATARAWLSRRPQDRIIVLEKEPAVGRHQTSRNSGVIHSGIYYKPGSLKASLCVRGAAQMAEFCRENRIAHEICGKVIVATRQEEMPGLERLYEKGKANGVPGLERTGSERLREIEPHASGLGALHVPGAGIVDYGQVAQTLSRQIQAAGATVRLAARVTGLRREEPDWRLLLQEGDCVSRSVINCAGLHADRLSRACGMPPDVQIVPFRGEYYAVKPERSGLVKAMIYPVPDPLFPFLGVHFTRDVHGGLHAGPNAVLALKREGYRKRDIDAGDLLEMAGFPGFWRLMGRHWRSGCGEVARSIWKPSFVKALRRLVPEIRSADLAPAPSGVRAQALQRDGGLVDDFDIVQDRGVVHVRNVPSPAATASLAIGEVLSQRACQALEG